MLKYLVLCLAHTDKQTTLHCLFSSCLLEPKIMNLFFYPVCSKRHTSENEGQCRNYKGLGDFCACDATKVRAALGTNILAFCIVLDRQKINV